MSKEKSKPRRHKATRTRNTKLKPDLSEAETSSKKRLIHKTATTHALAPGAGRESKQARLIALLQRPNGATIADLVAMTGWQVHSVRGVMSGALKKRLGLTITSEKGDGGRVYRIAVPSKAA
jgi:hypothetical protein